MFGKIFGAIASPFKLMFNIDPDRDRILNEGRPAVAKILEIGEAGPGMVTINDNPYVKFTIEVYDGNKDAYTTEIKRVISRLDVGALQPGAMVNVKIDPLDPMKVVFDTTATTAPKERMKIGNTEQTDIVSGKEGTAEILSISKTDKTKNGQEVYNVEFEVSGVEIEKYKFTKEIPLPDFALSYFIVGKSYPCKVDWLDNTKIQLDVNF